MFGDIVRAHRARLGLTQEDLSERTGVSVRSIGKIESGRVGAPRPHTVRLLADAFGLAGADRDHFCRSASAVPEHRSVQAVVPAQLPPDTTMFVGRADHLRRLDALLDAGPGPGRATVAIAAVVGVGGVGKTWLAQHWAHRHRDRFPDGQLFVNLRGFDPGEEPMPAAVAVRGFLDALGVPPKSVPVDLHAQLGLYRSLVAGRRMLVVLDNARDSAQVAPLLPGAGPCTVIVTSRDRLTGLVSRHGCLPVPMDVLDDTEARELLTRRWTGGPVVAEPAAVAQVVGACGGLPLALGIAAARVAVQPEFCLPELAAELRDVDTRLEALDDYERHGGLRSVLSWSYAALTPEPARAFLLLGTAPGPDLNLGAAAASTGLPAAETRKVLRHLEQQSLITTHAGMRWRMHDLVRLYAADEAGARLPAGQVRAALHRLLDYHLRTVYGISRLLEPYRDPPTLPAPRPEVTPESFADVGPARAWMAAEYPVLLAAAQRAADAGHDAHAWQLAWSCAGYLHTHGLSHEMVTMLTIGQQAVQRLGDLPGQAVTRGLLGHAYMRLGRYDEAGHEFRHALRAYEAFGDRDGQGHSHRGLALAGERRKRYAEALEHSRCAVELFRATGNRAGQAAALNSLGWFHAMLGDHRLAVARCEEALRLHQETGFRRGEAETWDSLGYAHHHLGDHQRAIACFWYALGLAEESGDRYFTACVLSNLGDTHRVSGDRETARTVWAQAVRIMTELAHPDLRAVQGKLREIDEAPTTMSGVVRP